MVDTMTGYGRALAAKAAGAKGKVFDWNEAARILRDRNARHAIAGLAGDMEWTSGEILADGLPVPAEETHPYLSSLWATPVLVVDGEEIPCFVSQDEAPEWNSDTYWPESARAIFGDVTGLGSP